MVTILYLCWNDANHCYADTTKLHQSVSKGRAITTGLEPGGGIGLLGLAKCFEVTIWKCFGNKPETGGVQHSREPLQADR